MKSLLTAFALLFMLLFTAQAQATTATKTDDPVVAAATPKVKANTTRLNEGEYVRQLNATKPAIVEAEAAPEQAPAGKQPSKREMRRLMRLLTKMEQEEIADPFGSSVPLRERE